jgi:hypothetical protein
MSGRARRSLLVVCGVLALCLPLLGAPPAGARQVTRNVNWEFARTAALPAGWTYAAAKGCTDAGNVWLSGGILTMRVGQVGTHPYCGARIQTKRTFNPPFTVSIRARFQLPAGMHAGATLYGADGDPWPSNGEVDLSEMTAVYPTQNHVRLWTQTASRSYPSRCGDPFNLSNFDPTAWHVYGADFGTDAVTFTLDGVAIHTTSLATMQALGCTWPYNQEAGLRMFLGVSVGGWGGSPSGPGYPAYQQFDYVRVGALP